MPSDIGSLDWHEGLSAIKLGGMARELAQHCELRAVDGHRIGLRLSTTHRHLQMKSAQEKLQQALSEHLGHSVPVMIELDDVVGDTPAAAAQRRRQERQEQAVASVEQDEFVREVIDVFDATLIESSIKPV
jgi:DNA polymerase-3 subunit gamma/tau